jgi:HEPN domain-containing protein
MTRWSRFAIEVQQAAEKALKAVMLAKGIKFRIFRVIT